MCSAEIVCPSSAGRNYETKYQVHIHTVCSCFCFGLCQNAESTTPKQTCYSTEGGAEHSDAGLGVCMGLVELAQQEAPNLGKPKILIGAPSSNNLEHRRIIYIGFI